MAGISDSGNPDDIRVHLEQIISADASRREMVPGESDRERLTRESVLLSSDLEQRVKSSLADISGAVPGLGDAEATKILTTRAGRDALKKGKRALARVDDHLRSVTGQQNPQIGRAYGVYSQNPRSFAGVYRALEQSVAENDRVSALPQTDAESKRAFTPYVALLVSEARDELRALLRARVETRAEHSQQVVVKDDVLSEAKSVISAVRSHLYANLPNSKRDPDLRDYGFRPPRARGGTASPTEEDESDDESEE